MSKKTLNKLIKQFKNPKQFIKTWIQEQIKNRMAETF